jgi:ABC-type nitrate/sulfonate/bicarbonate transport system substrate-binding protein
VNRPRLAALLAAAALAVAVVGQHGDTLLEHTTTRIDGQPTPGSPDQLAHAAGVAVGALPWITGW